jgi:hypothetical protein
MGMTEDEYKVFLEGISGKQSCAEMSGRQLEAALRAMRKNGFEEGPRRVREKEQGQATPAQLEYIKGMWQRCARNKSDEALAAFVNRIAHVKTLRFLTVYTARKVIPALREMSAKATVKAGFNPDTSAPLEARDG